MPKNYHLFLKGEVGSTWSGNFTSDMVNWILDKYKDSEVNVLVNSLGGYTHEGLAISSLFKTHGNVHVHYIGMNASAATIAAMGAKRITIDADAMFLVHKCSGLVFEWDMKNAEELDEYIKKLEKQKQDQNTIDQCVAAMYARRCKKTRDELLDLMSKDSWLSAREALEWGFVDEVTDDAEDKEPVDESTIASMSSAGMPVPPGYAAGKKGSVIDRFFAFLRSLNNREPEAPQTDEQPQSAEDSANTINSMDKKTENAPEVKKEQPQTEQPTNETAQQPQQSEKPQSDKDAEIASLKAQLAERDKTISELRKEPAESTAAVADDKKGETDKYAKVSEEDAEAAVDAFIKSYI